MNAMELVAKIPKFVEGNTVKGDSVEVSYACGEDEYPGTPHRRFQPNRTYTVTLKINGGARHRIFNQHGAIVSEVPRGA